MTNIVVSWANLMDSGRRKVADYGLRWSEESSSILRHPVNVMWQMATDGVYMAYLACAVWGVKILSFIANPTWLDGMVDIYENITERMFSYVNPILLGTLGFTILMVYVLFDKVKTSSMGMERRDVERVSAGLVMLCIVVFLALNPFYLMRFALSLVNTSINSFTGGSSGSQGGVSTTLVDALIRTPTMAINFAGGQRAGSRCSENNWSQDAEAFSRNCLMPEADHGTIVHLTVALFACVMAMTVFLFALVALYKFIKHLSFAIVGIVLLPWVAAVSMVKRRSFDLLGRTFAVAAGNLIMAVVVQVFAVLIPKFAQLFLKGFSNGTSNAVFSMVMATLGWFVSMLFLLYVTRKHSALVRMLRADATTALNTYMAAPGAPGAFFGAINNRTQNNQISNQLRQQLRKLRNYSATTEGEATPMGSENQGRSDLTTVQRVVNFGAKKFAPVRMLSMNSDRDFSSQRTTNFIRNGSDAGDMASAAASMRGAAFWLWQEGMRKDTPITVSPRTSVSMSITPESPSVHVNPIIAIPGGGSLNVLSDDAADPKAIRSKVLSENMNSAYPAFGGRSSREDVERVVESVIREVESRRVELEGKRGTVIDAEVISVTDHPAPSNTDKLAAYRNVRATRERASMRNLEEFAAGAEGNQAQSVVRANRGGRERVDAYPSYRSYRSSRRGSQYPSQLKGSSCTRGDTVVTVSQQVLRDGEADAVAESEINRARARGENVVIRIPSTVSSLVVTTDNPDMQAAGAGVGFGDRIY